MKEYRKKDVIQDEEIQVFETIEMNKIRSKTTLKPRRRFLSRKWTLILPIIALVFILGITLNDDQVVNPLLEDIQLVEINTITVSDLPTSLQGVHHMAASKLTFLSNRYVSSESLVFDDQEDVTGEAQQRLWEMIEEQSLKEEAKDMFDALYENLLYLELDTVSTFGDANEYYFTVNTDGTYVLTLRTVENDAINTIELRTYYEGEDFFYQAKLEVVKDDQTSSFLVKYNEDQTKKYQYGKFLRNGDVQEYYIYLEEGQTSTRISAMGKTNDEVYTVVADANDLHGVIFSSYMTEGVDITSTEYYDGTGSLLKQEEGFATLDVYNDHLEILFDNFEENPEMDVKNLSDIIDDFTQAESFTITIDIADSALARIQDVPAILMVVEEEYAVNYSFDDFLYSKKEEAFTSGDTLYHMTNYEVVDDEVIITFSALYDIPEKVTGPNGSDYYMNNKYMAKYIEAKEGYTIIQNEAGNYKLLNDELEGGLGDRIDIDITSAEYYLDGELHETLIFQHTSAIQFENLVFTKMDTINEAKTNLTQLYNELVPSLADLEDLASPIEDVFE